MDNHISIKLEQKAGCVPGEHLFLVCVSVYVCVCASVTVRLLEHASVWVQLFQGVCVRGSARLDVPGTY